VSVSSTGSLPEALSRAVDGFRKRDAPYVLIGAWALAVWGRPRATIDVDFLVSVEEEDLGRLSGRRLKQEWPSTKPRQSGIPCSEAFSFVFSFMG